MISYINLYPTVYLKLYLSSGQKLKESLASLALCYLFLTLFLTSLKSSIILFQDSNVTTYFIFTTLDM